MTQFYSSLIRQRTSRRTYSSDPLSVEMLASVRQVITRQTSGPLGTECHFKLIDRLDLADRRIRLGTYGFIQGARYFIAGQVIPSQTAFLDYGYLLEKIILELTGLGLGTCWLGGTFNRGEFARAIELREGYSIPAVTPVGFSTPVRGLGDQVIRLAAGSANRLPWKNLFFDHDTGHPLDPKSAGALKETFESVRLAPSASNKQPWRIFRDKDRYHFCLLRTPGYQNKFISSDLQMVDLGIAMCHWDMTIPETNFLSLWIHEKPIDFPDEPDYIISSLPCADGCLE